MCFPKGQYIKTIPVIGCKMWKIKIKVTICINS
jgi:hypothetical protein